MKCKSLIFIILLITPFLVKAQQDIKSEHIHTWMFEVTYAYQFPGKDTKADMRPTHVRRRAASTLPRNLPVLENRSAPKFI